MRLSALWVLWVVLAATASLLHADEMDRYLDLSLEELMQIPVVSGARTEQTLADLAVPVSVLTAEEIRRSGLTSLPELLALMPGVDVQRVDRTRYIVGVRGLLSMYSDRTLVLINGRDALNPVFGAPDWLSLPVLVEDIERIEVLRGPGGGVWGANAFTGVINIITETDAREPETSLSSTVNHFGDSYSHLKVARPSAQGSWRMSLGYEGFEDSDRAGAGRTESGYPALNALMGFNSYEARDMARAWRFDSEWQRSLGHGGTVWAGLAHTSAERGDRELVGQVPEKDGTLEMTRLFAKVDHEFDAETRGYLQGFSNLGVFHAPEMLHRYAYYEHDLEAQFQRRLNPSHQLTAGGNLRWTHLSSENGSNPGEVYYVDSGYDETWAGTYLVDRWTIDAHWSAEFQGRLDHYSDSGTDWSGRASLLRALDPEQNHVLRVSAARSFRAPGAPLRELRMQGLGGLFNLVAHPSELTNETITSLEAGYTGHWPTGLMVRVNGYHQRMEHLLGAVSQTTGFGVTNSSLGNLPGANAYGGECELDASGAWGRLTAWYAYNEMVTDTSEMSVRAYLPARHKAALRFHRRWAGWSWQANYLYNGGIQVNGSASPAVGTAVQHRLDLTCQRSFRDGRTEVMLGVQDLLNNTADPVYDVSYFTSYETPGRTVFARLKVQF